MKKHLTIFVTAVVLLMLFTACPSPPGIMGTSPMLLGGHFLFEQVYDTGRDIITYNPDGTYVHIGNEWNGVTEEWEQTYGSKGTYFYEASTYLMTWTSTERWGWGDVEDWYVLEDNYADDEGIISWSVTEHYTLYLTNNGMYNAYLTQPDGSWQSDSGYSHKEKRVDGDFEYSSKNADVYSITNAQILFTSNRLEKEWESDTALETYQREEGGTVRKISPTGVEWKAGQTVTWYFGNDTNQERWWDWDAGDWDVWNDYADGNTRTRTFVHLGDLILEVDVASSKNFIVE